MSRTWDTEGMTEVHAETYRIGRQRIVQSDKTDHALRPTDDRSLCDRHSNRALVLHEVAFVPYADHACEECSRLVTDG